jgi:imidazole glycerol-phosphate synthase subunit HisF
MALTHRIIAKILIQDRVAVKFKRFTESRRIVGDPISTARILEDQNVDEFFICDLGKADPEYMAEIVHPIFCPVTIAGSIHSMDHVAALFRDGGADKVVVKDIDLAENVAAKWGKQAVVYPIDYRGDAGVFAVPECAGELLLTSIDRDGTSAGYDLGALSARYSVPIILAGGCGKLSHVKAAFDGGAMSVAVSSMFAFTDKSPVKLRTWLASEGVNVRVA